VCSSEALRAAESAVLGAGFFGAGFSVRDFCGARMVFFVAMVLVL
jgi:hypothetical protein